MRAALVGPVYKLTKDKLKVCRYKIDHSEKAISSTFHNMERKLDSENEKTYFNKLIDFKLQNICVLSTIPNLIQELRASVPDCKFIKVADARDENLQHCKIVVVDFDLVAPRLYDFPQLKWIQGTWAGVETITPFINKPLPYQITRFSSNYFGQMITEYVIASIVNQERAFLSVWDNQKNRVWTKDGRIGEYRPISSLTVGILGIGNIGSWLGRCLHTFGAKVLGYGRRQTLDIKSEDYNYMASYHTKASLEELLKSSDYIVNVLPHTSETSGLLNGNLLQNCQDKKSFFINVGRGSIIDEEDLVNAVNKNWISGAMLDVFKTEPLPSNSLLWGTSNVHITPHVAAVSMSRHIAEQFQENLKLFSSNKPMPYAVKFGNLY